MENNTRLIDSDTGYHITDKNWNLNPDECEIFKVDGETYRVDDLLLDYDQGFDEGGLITPLSIIKVTKIAKDID